MLKKFGIYKKSIIGIPDPEDFSLPVNVGKTRDWDFVIQRHDALKAGTHYDLRLGDPSTNMGYSWALPQAKLPSPGEKIMAIAQPIHSISYFDFQGEIPEGYGAGKVTTVVRDKVEVLKAGPDKITFIMYRGSVPERYTLAKTSYTSKSWLLINHTPTRETRSEIPSFKPKYIERSFKEVDPNQDIFFSPKIDGSHTLFAIRPGKPIDTFSYRPSKRKTQLIDHTFKTPLHQILGPKNLGNTIVRGEMYAQSPEGEILPSHTISSLLNANTRKSREMQKQKGLLTQKIFDVDIYQGKNVRDLPYEQKLEILNKIQEEIPQLSVIPIAKTKIDKERLLSQIRSGVHPLTREGLVLMNPRKSIPEKAKLKKDIDVWIKGFYPPISGSKYQNNAVGGIVASKDYDSPPVIRIGSGFSDNLRRDMYNNPGKYLNNLIKIEYQTEYQGGKLRMPVFKEFKEMM